MNAKRKDNYSWLNGLDQESEQALILEQAYQFGYHKIKDGCLREPLKELNKIIEIEKLRAMIEIIEELGELRHEMEYIEFSEVKELLADLTEKLNQ